MVVNYFQKYMQARKLDRLFEHLKKHFPNEKAEAEEVQYEDAAWKVTTPRELTDAETEWISNKKNDDSVKTKEGDIISLKN